MKPKAIKVIPEPPGFKSSFVFEVVDSSIIQKYKNSARKNSFGMAFLESLALRLRTENFLVTQSRPGKALGMTSFRADFDFCYVAALLGARQNESSARCIISTTCVIDLQDSAETAAAIEAWGRICAAMERGIKETTTVRALHRLTESDADAFWKKFRDATTIS